MILTEMIHNDMESCYEAINSDAVLRELDKDFYSLEPEIDSDTFRILEELFSKYSVRMAHIAYVQGMKDLYGLCLALDESTGDIIKKYVDAI